MWEAPSTRTTSAVASSTSSAVRTAANVSVVVVPAVPAARAVSWDTDRIAEVGTNRRARGPRMATQSAPTAASGPDSCSLPARIVTTSSRAARSARASAKDRPRSSAV